MSGILIVDQIQNSSNTLLINSGALASGVVGTAQIQANVAIANVSLSSPTVTNSLGIGTPSPTAPLHIAKTLSGATQSGLNIQNIGTFTWGIGIDNSVSSGNLVFENGGLGGTPYMTLSNGGTLTFNQSGQGVQFNNSSASTNSILNDYETGTWTPAFQTGTFTYSRQTGYYTKIGNVVNASVDLLWASNSGGGVNISINIPFVIGGTSNSRAVGSFGFVLGMSFTSGTVPEISGNGTASNVNIYAMQPGGTTPTTLLNSALSSSGELQFSITYIASF